MPSNLYDETTNCNVDLTIKFNSDALEDVRWNASNICYEDAKEIYECSKNKSMCLLNSRHENSCVAIFSKIKIESFEEITPDSNWKQYDVWADIKNKIRHLNRKARKIENLIWKKGKNTTDDYKKLMDDMMKQFPNPCVPLSPTPAPIQPAQPYQPIWIDTTIQPNTGGQFFYGSGDGSGITISNSSDCGAVLLNSDRVDELDLKIDAEDKNFGYNVSDFANFTKYISKYISKNSP